MEMAARRPGVDGVVFGRVDFVGSIGRDRDTINDDEITAYIVDVAARCTRAGLNLVVGGGVCRDAVPALRPIRATHLTRFETRKVVFAASALDEPSIEQGLLNAVHLELLWLIDKREYYGRFAAKTKAH